MTGPSSFFSWGDQLRMWKLPELRSEILAAGHLDEGGCVVDLDQDGKPEWLGQEGPALGKLVWNRAPNWTS